MDEIALPKVHGEVVTQQNLSTTITPQIVLAGLRKLFGTGPRSKLLLPEDGVVFSIKLEDGTEVPVTDESPLHLQWQEKTVASV